jgi:hypothetical protein
MDAQDKSESKVQRREEPLARRIGQALDGLDSNDAVGCPDGEILAVYAERGLPQSETAKWESHFATCARCRKILLVLAESVDTPLAAKEVARLAGRIEANRTGAEPHRPARPHAWPTLADWRVRWLAPALGVAAVVAVFLVLRSPRPSSDNSTSQTLIAQAPKQEPTPPAAPEADRLSSTAPREEQKSLPVPQTARSLAREAAPLNSPVKRRAGMDAASNSSLTTGGVAASSETADKKSSAVEGSLEVQPPPPVTATSNAVAPQTVAPAAPVPQESAKAVPSIAGAQVAQLDQTGNATGGGSRDKQAVTAQEAPGPASTTGPALQQATPGLALGEQRKQAFVLARPLQKDSAMLKAPQGTAVWRAGLHGNIERSIDAGKTWVTQVSPSQEDWLAGAAVSDSVCWLVGRHGAIARTSDGEHWQLVSPPPLATVQRAGLTDFEAIAAADAKTATITSADGRKFSTIDGGNTWQPQ